MAESTRLVDPAQLTDLVQADLDRFLDEREPMLAGIADDLSPFVRFSRDLLRGGKRFRALFCYWGWRAAHSGSATGRDDDELRSVVLAASGLEIFHAAALVHDDIMDNSDTRRGMPAAHRRFERLHVDGAWSGAPTAFGQSAALLLGDLLLGWSDELFDSGIRSLDDPASARAARGEFNRMRTEVTVGQYLDILDERSWQSYPEDDLLARAHRVIVYKSAKYSIEAPLAIGASLAGGRPEQVESLKRFGLPLGIAYQLRDDLLGVFGDPAVTGKPSGDDLREGKRTVLIAVARVLMPADARRVLDDLLGDPDLDDQQVRMLQTSIEQCGAVDEVERLISHNVELALTVIADAPIDRTAGERLAELAVTVTRRAA